MQRSIAASLPNTQLGISKYQQVVFATIHDRDCFPFQAVHPSKQRGCPIFCCSGKPYLDHFCMTQLGDQNSPKNGTCIEDKADLDSWGALR